MRGSTPCARYVVQIADDQIEQMFLPSWLLNMLFEAVVAAKSEHRRPFDGHVRRMSKPMYVMKIQIADQDCTHEIVAQSTPLHLKSADRSEFSWRRWPIPDTEKDRPHVSVDYVPRSLVSFRVLDPRARVPTATMRMKR